MRHLPHDSVAIDTDYRKASISVACATQSDPNTPRSRLRDVDRRAALGTLGHAGPGGRDEPSFHGRDRGTAFGAYGATTGAAVAVGPLVGGALTDAFGWSAIFLVNLPIGIAAIALTLARVSESHDPDGSRIDVLGVVAFSGGLFCLVYALVRGNEEGWTSEPIVALLVASAVLLIVFGVIEARTSRPMLELSLFRRPAFVGASITGFALSASMFAMFLYITLYMQNVLGYEPLQAGLRFLPITLLSFLAAAVAGKLSARFPVRIFLGAGLTLVGLGLVLMHGVTAGSGWMTLLVGFLIAGVGIGMTSAPLASAAVGVVEPARGGMASGINSTFRQVGIATGIAALGAVFQHHVENNVVSGLAGTPAAAHAHEIGQAVVSGGTGRLISSVPVDARAQMIAVARDAFVSGLNTLFIIAAVTAFIGAALSAALVRQRDFITIEAPSASTA